MQHISATLKIDPPLLAQHTMYLQAFHDAKHIKREEEDQPDPIRVRAGLPFGEEGEYCLAPTPITHKDKAVPSTQPSIWCNWTVSDDGKYLSWDNSLVASTNHGLEWLNYLLKNFFKRWDNDVSGTVKVIHCGDSKDVVTLYTVCSYEVFPPSEAIVPYSNYTLSNITYLKLATLALAAVKHIDPQLLCEAYNITKEEFYELKPIIQDIIKSYSDYK